MRTRNRKSQAGDVRLTLHLNPSPFSCYMASVLQSVFDLPAFVSRYNLSELELAVLLLFGDEVTNLRSFVNIGTFLLTRDTCRRATRILESAFSVNSPRLQTVS